MRLFHPGLVIGSALAVAIAFVYVPACTHGFVNFDDDVYVTANPEVRAGLNPASARWAWTTLRASNWHPLTWLSLQLDSSLYGRHGENPCGYHLTNLLLHLANTLLLFGFLHRATGAVWRSGLVAALFAVHPLHVESVAWVAERKDVLSTLFWMLTLWAYLFYVKRPGLGRYLVIVLTCALGLLAKPMLVTLPCVLLLLDYWPLRRFPRPTGQDTAAPDGTGSAKSAASVGWLVAEKLPLLLLAAASCAVTVFAQQQGGALATLEHFSLPVRAGNALLAYTGYTLKMIWPLHLAPFYPHPRVMPATWQLAAAGLLLVGVSAVVLLERRRRPYLVVGWLWYIGTLVPVIGLVQVGLQAMADRYTYVPLIGLFLMVAWGLGELAARGREGTRVAVLVAALALVVCLVCSSIQVRYWRDSKTLWEHTLNVTARNSAAHNNLARVFEKQGRWNEALRHYQAALDIDAEFALYRNNVAVAHYHVGSSLGKQGRLDEAIEHLREAVRLKPSHAEAHNDLGTALDRQGRTDEAATHYQEALRLDPDLPWAHYNLGTVFMRQGKPAEAIAEFREAQRTDRDLSPELLDALARAYAKLNRLPDAVDLARKALALAEARQHTALAEAIRRRLDAYANGRSPPDQ
jgi:Flp pilus assembly protein TadD